MSAKPQNKSLNRHSQLVLIPGVSRSGATIATGMLMGLKRDAAAKFSFMLGGIAILAANVYALFSIRNGAVLPDLAFTLFGAATSFVISLLSISWLLKFLEKRTLRPFSFYLMILGALILMVFWGGFCMNTSYIKYMFHLNI